MVTIVCTAITAASTIVVAVIGALSVRDRKRIDARAAQRAKESRLSMDMMVSTSELSDVIAIAVSGGHINGNVEAARNKAKASRDAYSSWLKDVVAADIAADK